MPPELGPVVAIAGLIFVKEAGVPIPVPGDLVVIGAGVAAGRGEIEPAIALVAIVVASILGGIGQYILLRSVARPAMLRLVGRIGGGDRLERQTDRLRRGGVRSVAIARSTPGIRIVAIAASAIAGVPAPAFVGGLAIGNALFIAAHFALGYLVGEPIVTCCRGASWPDRGRRRRAGGRRRHRLGRPSPSPRPGGRRHRDGRCMGGCMLPGVPDARCHRPDCLRDQPGTD